MRRLFRWIVNGLWPSLCLLSLLACVGVVLQGHGWASGDIAEYSGEFQSLSLYSDHAGLLVGRYSRQVVQDPLFNPGAGGVWRLRWPPVEYIREPGGFEIGPYSGSRPVDRSPDAPVPRVWRSFAGVRAPHTLVAALLALPPLLWLGRFARRLYTHERRQKLHLCPACGYDLRATPERCPECGHAPAKKGASA